MANLIERDKAIDALKKIKGVSERGDLVDMFYKSIIQKAIDKLDDLPSAQPEVKHVSYQDCQNALLKMWMDNVVTDGEYRRIVDKLNAIQEEQDE